MGVFLNGNSSEKLTDAHGTIMSNILSSYHLIVAEEKGEGGLEWFGRTISGDEGTTGDDGGRGRCG